jgi:hypothetical protein
MRIFIKKNICIPINFLGEAFAFSILLVNLSSLLEMMMMFTSKDYNEGVTKSNLHKINADQPKRNKLKQSTYK